MAIINLKSNGKKAGSLKGGGEFWRIDSFDQTRADLWNHIRQGDELIFTGADEYDQLLKTLKVVQGKETDTEFLSRIFKNGGFTEYIRKLELTSSLE